jgi:replicative DNA helicase
MAVERIDLDAEPSPGAPRDNERDLTQLPHNPQAEEAVLGSILKNPASILEIADFLRPEDFHKPQNRHVFRAMLAVNADGRPIDYHTVSDELRQLGVYEASGGILYLTELNLATPTAAHIEHYGRIVERTSFMRQLIGRAQTIAEMAYRDNLPVDTALEKAERLILALGEKRVTRDFRSLEDVLSDYMEQIEAMAEGEATKYGIPTGFIDLDKLLGGFQRTDLIILAARTSVGKALALDTPIPTPSGWTTMGDLRVGDQVFDEQGKPCHVTYVSPVWRRDCYRLTFEDGATLVADGDHRWVTMDTAARAAACAVRNGRSHTTNTAAQLRTTLEIRTSLTNPQGYANHAIATTQPLDLPEKADLPVEPYAFGLWLGDGVTGLSEIAHDVVDAPLARQQLASAGVGTTTLANRWKFGTTGLAPKLRRAGVLRSKHVPDVYFRASVRQRLALLQGLLDSHGSVMSRESNRVSFDNTNEQLADAVHELACGLGMKAVKRLLARRTIAGKPVWRVEFAPTMQVFRLARKASRVRLDRTQRGRSSARFVVAVELCDPVPTRCIAVDSPSHLYLAGKACIPTHNTSFALNLSVNAAVKHNATVAIFSLEMSAEQLASRLLSMESGVDSPRIRAAHLNEQETRKLDTAMNFLAKAPIWVDDTPSIPIMELRSKARRLAAEHGLDMIVVDYLQLIASEGGESRVQELGQISRALKALARELRVPILALSQLSRAVEQRTPHIPQLSDLRESGALEQDADVVTFIYRDEKYNPDTEKKGVADIIVAKHRNGPTGQVQLLFLERTTKFLDLEVFRA